MVTAGAETSPLRPPLFITDKKVDRRLFAVPRDQQKLLDREDAWEGTQRNGCYNIPGSVLEGLTTAAQAKRRKPTPPPLPPPSSIPEPVASPLPSLHSTRHKGSESRAIQANNCTDDEDESQISWSATPTPQVRRNAPGSVRTGADFLTDQYMTGPMSYPSSHASSDVELELAIPNAISRPLQGVNKRAILAGTPPSAQVIPCSYANTSKPTIAATPALKRSRPMKSISFEEQEKKKRMKPNSSFALSSPPRLDSPVPTARSFGEEGHDALVIPATNPDPTPQLIRKTNYDVVLAPDTVRQESSKPPWFNIYEDKEIIPATIAISEANVDTSSVDELLVLEEAHTPAPQAHGPLWPHDIYMSSYPDYKGSAGDFLKAAFYCINEHKKGSLASFMYDDVIRAFFEGYLGYHDNAKAQNREPWHLMKWYNRETKTLRYNKNVVTSDNLAGMLEAPVYQDELQQWRKEIRKEMNARESDSPREPPGSSVEMQPTERSKEATQVETQALPIEQLQVVKSEPRGNVSRNLLGTDVNHEVVEAIRAPASLQALTFDLQPAAALNAEPSFRRHLESQVPLAFSTPLSSATQEPQLRQLPDTSEHPRPKGSEAETPNSVEKSFSSVSTASTRVSKKKRRSQDPAQRQARWIAHVKTFSSPHPSSSRGSFGG